MIRELEKSKGRAKQKTAKEAREIAEMKGKQIKDAMLVSSYDATVHGAT